MRSYILPYIIEPKDRFKESGLWKILYIKNPPIQIKEEASSGIKTSYQRFLLSMQSLLFEGQQISGGEEFQ